jgi:hypothetical protein
LGRVLSIWGTISKNLVIANVTMHMSKNQQNKVGEKQG